MNHHPSLVSLLSLALLFLSAPLLASATEVNVYSARKEALIKPLLEKFTHETGIKVNLVTGKADALLSRLTHEGINTPADLLITVDAGRLHRAVRAGVLQRINDATLNERIPNNFRDPAGHWFGLSQRARVIFYNKNKVDPTEITSYEDLADPKWKKRICIRSSGNIYNQSLVAAMIAANGSAKTEQWATELMANLARKPNGGDRDQMKAAAAGQCDLAVANTYYYGKMLHAKKDPAQRDAANKLGIIWPNQNGRGVHVNISGAGITKHAKHRDNAIKLLRYLVSDAAQAWYAEVNYEYPVVKTAATSDTLKNWGDFKIDTLNLSLLGEHNATAVRIMDRARWK